MVLMTIPFPEELKLFCLIKYKTNKMDGFGQNWKVLENYIVEWSETLKSMINDTWHK